MEKDARDFLQRIIWTISSGLLWLLINTTAGIKFGWLIIEGHIRTGNIVFYTWFILSLIALIFFYIKIWKKKFPIH